MKLDLRKLFIVAAIMQESPFAQMPGMPMNFNYFNFGTLRPSDVKAFLKSGQVLQGMSRISNYIFKDGQYITLEGLEITPAVTDSIIADSLHGIPAGNIRVWRTVSGRLTMYTEDLNLKSTNYQYFQKGNGTVSLTPFSTDALKQAVADNPNALKFVQSYQKGKIVFYSMIATGVGIATLGFCEFMTKNPRSGTTWGQEITILTGMTICIGASVPYFMTTNNRKKAIKEYNKQ
ncbi:MAG: hypothetical protein JW699_07875 [Chitinispirillaceae bacterium]|nr:hypothetical protein [Chitinispirillaceae bacterium]